MPRSSEEDLDFSFGPASTAPRLATVSSPVLRLPVRSDRVTWLSSLPAFFRSLVASLYSRRCCVAYRCRLGVQACLLSWTQQGLARANRPQPATPVRMAVLRRGCCCRRQWWSRRLRTHQHMHPQTRCSSANRCTCSSGKRSSCTTSSSACGSSSCSRGSSRLHQPRLRDSSAAAAAAAKKGVPGSHLCRAQALLPNIQCARGTGDDSHKLMMTLPAY